MNLIDKNDAIYEQIAQNGLGCFRPVDINGKVHVINAAGQLVERPTRNSALPLDTWKSLDAEIASVIRTDLNVFNDIFNVGTKSLGTMEDALGTMLDITEMSSDSGSAQLDMDGRSKINNDAPIFSSNVIPLPMVHDEFNMSVRYLHASSRGAYGRGSSVSIDTIQAANSARKIAEKLEDLAIIGGGSFSYANHPVYGVTTAPHRATATFSKKWVADSGAATAAEAEKNVRDWISEMFLLGFGGNKVFNLYLPKEYQGALNQPWSTNYDGGSLKNYLLNTFTELNDIKIAFRMPADNIVMMEMRPRTCKIINGFAPTVINWASPDSLVNNWKILGLQIPKFYYDYNNVCGILHATYSAG